MTIGQAKTLIWEKEMGELRMPKLLLDLSKQEMQENVKLAGLVWNMFGKTTMPKKMNYTYKHIVKDKPKGIVKKSTKFNLIIKTLIKNSSLVETFDVELANGAETYKLKTKYFEGEFYDGACFFHGKWPNWLKPNNCYENSYTMCLMFGRDGKGMETKQITGIISSDLKKSYLHSICWVKTKKGKEFVFDGNAHLFISYSLYKNLFNFEPLNEISLDELQEGKPYILKYAKECEANGGELKNDVGSLAWQDVVAIMKAKEARSDIV